MKYKLLETREALDDVEGFAEYIVKNFNNIDAARDFLDKYDREVERLKIFHLVIGELVLSIMDMRLG